MVRVYDPCGTVDVTAVSAAPRVTRLDGLRLGILDNAKWNASRLLRSVREGLTARHRFGVVSFYRKQSFSRNAAPELIADIASHNDIVLTAVGD